MIMQFICTSEWIVLADWHLEVFLYYKIKNAGVHVFSIIHPNIYYRTCFFKFLSGQYIMPNQLSCQKYPIHDGSIAFCRSSDIILLTNRYGDVGVKTCQLNV